MKTWTKWLISILSFILLLIGFFYIPILSTIEMKYNVSLLPERGIMMIMLIPIVIITSLPFCIWIVWLIVDKMRKR